MACVSEKEIVLVENAPKPIGPYSVAIKAGPFLFCSGQLGIDPATGDIVEGGVEAETRQACKNVLAVLEAGGTSATHVVKTTVFLRDMNEFAKMNAIYGEFFGEKSPARSAVQVAALPKFAAVEIEVIALIPAE